MSEICRWLEGRARTHESRLLPVSVSECVGWMQDENGIRRTDGRFFGGIWFHFWTKGREVPEWFQFGLVEHDAPGTLGTVVFVERDGQYLVRAIPEPCNEGVEIDGTASFTLFGPTIQYSADNRLVHSVGDGSPKKASPTPLIGFFENPDIVNQVRWQRAAGSGGRHRQVVQIGLLTLTPGSHASELIDDLVAANLQADDFRWITRDELLEIYREGLANHHLRSISSLLL